MLPRRAELTYVVGIGASAGGLEALERLFASLPSDTGMAFVVLQHLSPDFKSLMGELLGRRTALPVHQARDGEELLPNAVYLLPPKKEMILHERRLVLADKDPNEAPAHPIDKFLRSLAQDVGNRSVAVILSGSGSDGSRGIRDVKRAGGVVFAESEFTAKFDGMPRNAVATGVVDHVLPPEEIALALAELAKRPLEPGGAEEVLVEESSIETLFRLLREAYGINFAHYKTSTVTRRIQRRLALNNERDLESYLDRLVDDPTELSSLYQDLLIGVTRFFRDAGAFEVLEKQVVPQIVERVPAGEEIRVWVPACATGEEAYSIAMLLTEQLEARGRPPLVKVLATDVHRSSLDVASVGVYPESVVEAVDERRRARFFRRKADGYHVDPALRQMIVFAPHNVIRDAPFTRLDLISCRNLLIYLRPQAQKTVLSFFHFGLKTGGALLLGSTESPGALRDEFETVDEHWKVFKKRRDVRLITDVQLSVDRTGPERRLGLSLPGPRQAHPDTHLLGTYDRLLDRFMPPSLLVDEDRHLLDVFGGAEKLLRVKRRRPSQNVLEMLEGELRTVVTGAIQRALKEEGAVRYTGVRVGSGTDAHRVTLTAEAFNHTRANITHVLLSFVDEATSSSPALPVVLPGAESAAAIEAHQAAAQRLSTVEDELSYTKETLQAAIEELETSNEELQATNEELVASNEELQSTNEELHSVNEELYTVNAEYQKKIVELKEMSDDVQHLLNETDIGTLFLDHELRVRKFTPNIARVFRFLPHDVGRQLRDFSHNIDRPGLLGELERALWNGERIEDEVYDAEGRCLLLRIVPYRASRRQQDDGGTLAAPDPGGRIEGVVLTLTDISSLSKARAGLSRLSAIVKSSDDAIVGIGLDGLITSWNEGAERLYGRPAAEAIGSRMDALLPDSCPARHDVLERVRRGEHLGGVGPLPGSGEPGVEVSVKISPVLGRSGEPDGAALIARDITALRRVQRELEERDTHIRALLDSTAEAILGFDVTGACTFGNAAAARLLGLDATATLVGRNLHELLRPATADGEALKPESWRAFLALRERRALHVDDEHFTDAGGERFSVEYWSHPVVRAGALTGAVLTFVDVTERKRTERALHEALRRREQFLAMLSHELRNPLAAIVHASHLLGRSASRPDAQARARAVIDRQAKHMARLLDDLLDVSRITRGKIEIRRARLDLRDAVHAGVEAVRPSFEQKGVRLEVELPDEPSPVDGDDARLQQVVVNLLSNAARYSDPGTLVTLTLARRAGYAELHVRDQGVGMDEETRAQVFDEFFQAAQPLDRPQGGLGIGLTVVQRVVQLHGGEVSASSEGPGRGSTFLVRLPLGDEAQPGLEEALHVPAKKVLLVDDEDDFREMFSMLLEDAGATVVEATDGREAIEVMLKEKPDLAFVDIGLPGFDGYEVARQARGHPELDGLRLIAVSGYGQSADVRAAREAGFDEHVRKPPEADRLLALLRS